MLCCLAASQINLRARAEVVDGNHIMNQGMSENLCALTFDDGPSIYTPQLLDMLEAYKIPATFFILGQQAQRYPDTVRRILAEGHEIGSHSWSHPNLRKLSTERMEWELKSTDAVLRSLGAAPFFMRPPYGSFDDRAVRIAEELGMSVILWSLDSYDWKHLPEDYSKLRSTRGTVYEEGALRGIFLFHDIHKGTVEDLPRIIANLLAGGCQKFVTVSDYLRGILDPEPPLLMSRRSKIPTAPARAALEPPIAAGSGPMPLARCSKPWQPPVKSADENLLEDAHAAVESAVGGM